MNDYIEWYYYPFYGAVIASFLAYAHLRGSRWILDNHDQEKWLFNIKNRIFLTYIFAFLLSSAFHVTFPVAAMEVPSGSYNVGTQIYDWTDGDRLETYGNDAGNELRRIKVQVWYPASTIEGFQRLPWIPEGRVVSRKLAWIFYFPPFMLDQSEEVLSNSYLDAPVLDSENLYPAVVLSHGWSGFRTLHTDLGELLASHGYIVFGIDHTYGAPVVIFEDGKEVNFDGEALPRRDDPKFLSAAENFVSTYGEDISFVLDVITEPDGNHMDEALRKVLNKDKIGLLGHSTGGGAGVKVAGMDSRVQGIIGLDPWVEAFPKETVEKEIKSPFLFLRSEEWEGQNNDENLMEILSNNENGTLYQILGTTHVDFTMIHMYSTITSMVRLTGSIERDKFEEIQEDFVLSFFAKYLKEEDDGIDYIDEKYEEVHRVTSDKNDK